MRQWCACVGVMAVSALFAVGCSTADDGAGGEEVGAVEQAELDPGMLVWRLYSLLLGSNPFAKVLVINGKSIGNYAANTEYWYVQTAHLSDLGSQALKFTYQDGSGTPSAQSGDQQFSLPLSTTWSSFSSDPVSGGSLYNLSNVYLRIHNNSSGLTRVTWYQTTSGTPVNVTANGTFSAVANAPAVTAPSGQTAYDIDATIQ